MAAKGEDMVCSLNINLVGTLLHSCRTGSVGKLLFKKLILLVDEKECEELCRNCSRDWLGKQ